LFVAHAAENSRPGIHGDGEYLFCRSRGLNKIQMIDGGTSIFTRISSGAIVGVGTTLNTNRHRTPAI
jgi:hypothetical protein